MPRDMRCGEGGRQGEREAAMTIGKRVGAAAGEMREGGKVSHHASSLMSARFKSLSWPPRRGALGSELEAEESSERDCSGVI